jgi:hypothetical protein
MHETFVWPPSPYKGLSYYGPNDVPLFAGRDDAVRRCARQLADRNTRVLILQGPTGCGKSSFLRAGLIPFLENQRGRYEFARSINSTATISEALFVRCTGSPLKALAAELFKFATNAEVQTEDGPEKPDFSGALLGCKQAVEFVEKAGGSGELLIQSLRAIAGEWPRTLVLIVDQGEEVLTLKSERDEVGELARKSFFDFIYRFNQTDFDLKLIIAIRTEYYGKFVARMGRSNRDLNRVEVFYLSELAEADVLEAIKRPTLASEIPPYGKPRDHYPFSFEPELPERIARDVFSQNIKGGILPVVQIVCENLYKSAKKKSGSQESFVVTLDDYNALPKVEIQLEQYLKQKLMEFSVGQNLRPFIMDSEVDRWKDVLSGLSASQVDGTVVTQLKSKEELHKLANKAGCRLPFEATMEYLSNPKVRILRGEELVNSVTNTPIWAYSLGHDAIGLVMERWKELKQVRERRFKLYKYAFLVYGILNLAVVIYRALVRGAHFDLFTAIGLTYAFSSLFLGLAPRTFLEANLSFFFRRRNRNVAGWGAD